MSTSTLNEEIELYLNIYLELRDPKTKDVLDKVDNARKVTVFVDNPDYTYDKVLTIFNYGTHISVIEYYKSRIGEVTVERSYVNIKPSTFLRMILPNTFK